MEPDITLLAGLRPGDAVVVGENGIPYPCTVVEVDGGTIRTDRNDLRFSRTDGFALRPNGSGIGHIRLFPATAEVQTWSEHYWHTEEVKFYLFVASSRLNELSDEHLRMLKQILAPLVPDEQRWESGWE